MGASQREPGRYYHRWYDASGGYADHYCADCGLGSWESEGTGPCRGQRVYACSLQSNAHTHGRCIVLFADREAKRDHWRDAHADPSLPTYWERLCLNPI